jgi:hypothetical protein
MKETKEVVLFAWVGEDEFGSEEIGLKQAYTPVGLVPLVSVDKDEIGQQFITEQLQKQANKYGKTIKLCKFVFSEEVITVNPVGMN